MMLPLIMFGLLAVAPAAPQSAAPANAQPPPAPPATATAPGSQQVDLKGITQALGSMHSVPAPNKCGQSPEDQARRSAVSVLGSIGGFLVPGAGMVAAVALPAAAYLSDQLLTMLDCKEQQQAAKATEQAIRGGLGTEVSWKSETRPNVTGKSKVTAQEKLADGSGCLTVTDVVIVDGQETTVPKRMCRAKGASGYVRA
jgi:hypothetical protein